MAKTISQIFLVFDEFLRCAGQVFCRMPLCWNLSDVFSHNWTRDMGFGGDHTGEGSFLSHHIICTINVINLNLDHLVEVVLSGFPTVKLLFSPPFL